MSRILLIALSLVVFPSIAFAQSTAGPGSGTDLYRVQREWEAIMRDGRYQQLLQDGQANKQAFDQLRQSDSDPTTTGSTRTRRR